MTWTVTIPWQGAPAVYALHRDAYHVFECRLVSYPGVPAKAPPSFLLLLQSGGHWICNLELPKLAEALGRCIEDPQATPLPLG